MSKWLLRKTSGSRSRLKIKGDYADVRNKKMGPIDELPAKEAMRQHYGNDHTKYLDTSLVARWLNSKVGKDFDEVYAEFLTRIQPKHLDEYRDCIFWYLEKNPILKPNGEIWGTFLGFVANLSDGRAKRFYVDPRTNKIVKIKRSKRR